MRFWVLVVLLAYTLFGFFAAPRLVENTLADTFASVDRTFSVEKVEVNPFTLTLRLTGARLDDTDGTSLLSFGETFVNFQATSLFRWAWTFKELSFVDYEVFEERLAEGGTRWIRLLEALTPEPEEPAPPPTEPPEAPPRVIVQELNVTGAAARIVDRQVEDWEGRFGPIDVSVRDVRTVPDHLGRQRFVVNTPEGGVLEWSGDIQLVPFASSGRLSVQGEALVNTLRYASHLLPFDVTTGAVDVGLDYRVSDGADGLELAVDGMELGLDDIRVVRDGQAEPWLALERLAVAGARIRWPEQRVTIDKVTLTGADVEAWIDADGALNLLELIPETETDEAAAGEPLTLEVAEVVVENSTVRAEDRAVEPPGRFVLQGVGATVSGVDLADGTRMPVTAEAAFADGGSLAFDGEVAVFPEVEAGGALRMDAFALSHAQPYLSRMLNARVGAGTLSLDGRVAYGPAQPGRYTGSVGVDGFELVDVTAGERVTAWQALRIGEVDADLAANAVTTKTVAFTAPYARLHIAEDRSTNIGDLFVEAEAASEGSAGGDGAAEAEAMAITVGGVTVAAGALDFSDFSLPLRFLAEIRGLDGEVSTLSTASAEPASVNFEGQVNEYGEARIGGSLDAFDFTNRADITVTFRNLDMSRLTPYTVSFAGYPVEDGRLDADLQYRLSQRQLEADNGILVRQLELGEKSDHPDAGSLPLKLAVALLTDSKGEIDVDLPISGDLDDPEFRIGGVVLRAIGNLITKVVSAPFRFLGSLVGVDSEDFGRVAFRPGDAEVSPPDREKLAKLAEAMRQRPELALKVFGVVAEEADGEALRTQAVDAALEATLGMRASDATVEQRIQALEAMAAERAPDLDLAALRAEHTAAPPAAEGSDEAAEPVFDALAYAAALRGRLIEREPVPAGALDALAAARAEAIVAALNAEDGEGAGPPLAISRGERKVVEADDEGLVALELEVTAEES